MNKFQKDINFQNIEDFFDHLPENELGITLFLRDLVLKANPNLREKLSYNVPYFFLKKAVCYIWPGSVPWGKISKGVSFGFCGAQKIKIPEDYFTFGNRKTIANRIFYSVEEIDVDKILFCLNQY